MKTLIKQYFAFSNIALLAIVLSSCEDFLNQVPEQSKLTPDQFLNSEADLAAYSLGGYTYYSGGGGYGSGDQNSDSYLNPATINNGWVPGLRRVSNNYGAALPAFFLLPASAGWTFDRIRHANYFFEQVLPKLEANKLLGSATNINHYIGEVHVNRAFVYFDKLQLYGDFPIIKGTFNETDKQRLIDANKRIPRNQVARYILADLDTAISLLSMTNKNRITKDVALLLKSRVALFEATWLKFHKGTPFVPGGPGWPGEAHNPGFTINIDVEIDFFLTQAMDAAMQVADKIDLTTNSHVMNPDVGIGATGIGWNPFFEMYNDKNLDSYPEVLMWRDYDRKLGVFHVFGAQMISGPGGGVPKGQIDAFLMQNGLPKYAAGSGFGLDSTIQLEKANRDERLQLFICGEKDVRYVNERPSSNAFPAPSPATGGGFWGYPPITYGSNQVAYTGYMPRKYYPYGDIRDFGNSDGEGGILMFRAAEAYLNYIEASYIKEGSINSTAASYWQKIRIRASVDPDFQKTIANTNLSQEDNWAKYSGTTMVDETMYNIRRERNCEFLFEGLRWMDLKRWRALDMVKNYQPKGFNLWDNTYKQYKGQYALIEPGGSQPANVSSKTESKYLLPLRKDPASQLWNGLNWTEAFYLEPIGFQAFFITTNDITGNPEQVIYQNPYWPTEAGGAASQ